MTKSVEIDVNGQFKRQKNHFAQTFDELPIEKGRYRLSSFSRRLLLL